MRAGLFAEMVGCALPLQQAPMGAVAGPMLARAVSQAGGLGMVSPMGLSPEEIDQLFAKVDGARIGANFITAHVEPSAVRAVAPRVRLVDFFWTDPSAELVRLVHAGGALASWQVGSVAEARAAVGVGCDLIAVQGVESGGHVRGQTPLMDLLEQVLDVVPVPVLAAGGVVTAPDVARCLRAGAAGVRVGTRLLATSESAAHPRYKQALVGASAGSTQITSAFADCPMCATSPRARVLTSCLPNSDLAKPLSGRPPDGAVHGEIEAMALYAGAGVGQINAIAPAAEVVAGLFA